MRIARCLAACAAVATGLLLAASPAVAVDICLGSAYGKLTPEQTLFGFASQAFWFAVGLLIVAVLWRSALRKYSAVGA